MNGTLLSALVLVLAPSSTQLSLPDAASIAPAATQHAIRNLLSLSCAQCLSGDVYS